jgi:nucleotide-binding universal stress UspA family protein
MLRSILIGLDSSPTGIAARELGVQWSQQLGCRLVGITIVDGPVFPHNEDMAGAAAWGRGEGSTLVAEPKVKVARCLRAVEDAFRRRCCEAGAEYQVVEDIGSPHVQILLEAQKHDAVLLGQHSRFDFGWEGKPGATLGKVLQDSPRPVVVVPEPLRVGPSIAVAYDGSLQAARVLASFAGTGLGGGRAVHVITAAADDEHRHAVRVADRAIAFLNNHGLSATPHIVEATQNPGEAILKLAQDLHAGLLVMGAYGQSMLREFFLGSVTRTALEQSSIPLFCYH